MDVSSLFMHITKIQLQSCIRDRQLALQTISDQAAR